MKFTYSYRTIKVSSIEFHGVVTITYAGERGTRTAEVSRHVFANRGRATRAVRKHVGWLRAHRTQAADIPEIHLKKLAAQPLRPYVTEA